MNLHFKNGFMIHNVMYRIRISLCLHPKGFEASGVNKIITTMLQ